MEYYLTDLCTEIVSVNFSLEWWCGSEIFTQEKQHTQPWSPDEGKSLALHPENMSRKRWIRLEWAEQNADCRLQGRGQDTPALGGDSSLSVITIQFQFSRSVCPTLCGPMNRSMPGLPVHRQLLEFTQTHIHRVGDPIQPSLPLSSPSPPAPNPSQHQGLFQWVNSSHEVARVLEF